MRVTAMISIYIAIIRYCVVAAGIALGYYMYFTWSDARIALEVVLLSCVAVTGVISFASHVVFHKSDARRLGLESANPGFQFEVGFANLAIGLVALLSVVFGWGVAANMAILFCYSLYILQSVAFHLYRYVKGEKRSPGYLWGSIVFGALYVGNMLFFVIAALRQENFRPL
jgi:hypothetical protein